MVAQSRTVLGQYMLKYTTLTMILQHDHLPWVHKIRLNYNFSLPSLSTFSTCPSRSHSYNALPSSMHSLTFSWEQLQFITWKNYIEVLNDMQHQILHLLSSKTCGFVHPHHYFFTFINYSCLWLNQQTSFQCSNMLYRTFLIIFDCTCKQKF